MSEPVYHNGELNEGQKRGGELVVTGVDPTVAFDPTEEVLNVMPTAVVAAMERDGRAARPLWWDAHAGALACARLIFLDDTTAAPTIVFDQW
ncbi:MAG TPA: hypothetical protein VMI53_00610 [Opitutaceae bacterium]|nr:hypothetical protein [Opitutaceae bacterium]